MIPGEERLVGLSRGDFCDQVMPFHTHVSLESPGPSPPNNTISPWVESKAIAWPCRAGGLVTGDFSVHALPSHTHVSFRSFPPTEIVPTRLGANPPNNTTWPCAVSYAIALENRPEGLIPGYFVQFDPSQRHVAPVLEEASTLYITI